MTHPGWQTHHDPGKDRRFRWLLIQARRLGILPSLGRKGAAGARKLMAPFPQPLRRVMEGPVPQVPTEDGTVAGRGGPIPWRLYRGDPSGQQPLVVFFHGGGFVAGDLESHDHLCHLIAGRTPATVLAVDYRLAPEHPYPAAVHDCLDVLNALPEAIPGDRSRLVLMGDSAGGNLCAAVSLANADAGGPALARQVLIYPATDGHHRGASHTTNANEAILTRSDIRFFMSTYLKGQDGLPRYYDILGQNDLEKLPPTSILIAGADPLRDDGRELAQRLLSCETEVTVSEYTHACHGFLMFPGLLPSAQSALDWCIAEVRRTQPLRDRTPAPPETVPRRPTDRPSDGR